MEQKSETRLRYQSKRYKYGGGSFRLQSYIGLVLDAKQKIKFRIAKSRFSLVKKNATQNSNVFQSSSPVYKKQTKEKSLKGPNCFVFFLTLRIIVTNMGHMIFIMLKKKSLTNHLLLTNPTAVFLNNDRSCISYTSVSGFSQCLLVLCKTCGPDISAFTSCSLPFTGFQTFGQTFVFLGKFKWPFLSVNSFVNP